MKKRITFAHPVASILGTLVDTLEDDGVRYHVSVFREAPGKTLARPSDFTKGRMKEWGRLIGRMHQATMHYRPKSGVEPRPSWNTERGYSEIHNENKDSESVDEFYPKFCLLEKRLQAVPRHENTYGLIHADVHHGNFLVADNDAFTVFDFDDCHYHWFAYDLAVPMFTLAISLKNDCEASEIKQLHEWMLEGYNELESLEDIDYARVETFILLRNFIMYYWIKRNAASLKLDQRSKEWMDMANTHCREAILSSNRK